MNISSRTVTLMMVTAIAVSVTGVYALTSTSVPTQDLKADGARLLGHVELTVHDADGNIKAYRQTDNLIVNQGLSEAVDKLFATSITGGGATFTFVGVGTGTTSAAAAQTNLIQQISNKRTGTVTGTGAGTGASSNASIVAFWAAGKLANTTTTGGTTNAITEASLFDTLGNNTGLMFARQTFSAINVGTSDSLTVTWTITFADSDTT